MFFLTYATIAFSELYIPYTDTSEMYEKYYFSFKVHEGARTFCRWVNTNNKSSKKIFYFVYFSNA